MSNKIKTEGGQGGKKGHSNMVHWGGTEEIKKHTKRIRRHQDKEIARKAKQGDSD
jgi:hypothetical protein